MKTDEIRALAGRVKDLRQELESVEARLRELSGDGAPLAPIESIDSPTVLTTNHAQRRARADRLVPLVAALGAVIVLAGGIGIGYALRPAPAPPPVITVSTSTAPVAPPPATAPPALEPAPVATADEPPVAEPTSAVASAAPARPAPSVIPARAVVPAPRGKTDYGF